MKTPNWQITATTVKCDMVDDEITIMVKPDGSARCASYDKYAAPDKKTLKEFGRKAGKTGADLHCEGPLCARVTEYRDRILAEENEG